jgi:predicted NUDIX family NTP pyrophosphohydrolase
MKTSAGILMFRLNPDLGVFLVHPGGPFFARKDAGYWTIPKGEFDSNELPIEAAVREFKEETGINDVPKDLICLGDVIQKSGKKVYAWAFDYNFTGTIKSNVVEHPKFGTFPEVDKGQYFSIDEAKTKINPAQFSFVERLVMFLPVVERKI